MAHAGKKILSVLRNLRLARRGLHSGPGAAAESIHGTIQNEFPSVVQYAVKIKDTPGIETDWQEHKARSEMAPSHPGNLPRRRADWPTPERDRRRWRQIPRGQLSPPAKQRPPG